jgi:methionine-rich copper-binding protein CopC
MTRLVNQKSFILTKSTNSIPIAFLLLLLSLVNPLYGQLTLTSSTPTANATNIDAGTDIALTFSDNLNASTVNTTNIVVRGQQSGAIAGLWSVSSAVATFTPTANLVAGEVIHIEIKSSVQSSGGASATKKALSFTVSPAAEKVGNEWTAAAVAEANQWLSVTFGNGRFVAVAYSFGPNRVMYSDDGDTWTAATGAEVNLCRSVTYGNGRFVAVAADGPKQVMYSDDGAIWTAATTTDDNTWTSVTYGNGRFVAVAANGTNQVMYSVDGAIWTATPAAEANEWRSVTYGNGRFVAVAQSGENRVMYSDDGATWTAAPASEANFWGSVTYGNGRFVAVAGDGTNQVMYSEDGATWTAAPAKEANDWRSVTFGNGRFVAVAISGTNRVMYSDDGVTWTAAPATEAIQWVSVTYGNGRFVAVAHNGTNRVMVSTPTPITLTSSTPTANATNIDAGTDIDLTFSDNLNASTVNTTNIVVRGQQSGIIAGTWSVAGEVATFNPTSDLEAGEVIHVEIKSSVQNSGGAPATKKALSFTVSPAAEKVGSHRS